MFWCKKDGKGECVSVLRTLMGGGKRVKVETRDGLMFIDEIMRIADVDGASAAIFSSRNINISDIERVEVVAEMG